MRLTYVLPPWTSAYVGTIVACCCLVSAQGQSVSPGPEDIDSALSEVYGTLGGNSSTDEKKDDNNMVSVCECVPFYQCKNDTGASAPNEYGEGVIDIRVPLDCSDYLDVCCNMDNQLSPEAVTRKPPPKDVLQTCGSRHPEGIGFKITGDFDNEANYGEFPWMVALLRKDHVGGDAYLKIMECGGSIIHPQVILTGAHCVKQKKNLFIRAGEWDTQTEKELFPIQERNVKDIIIHENYYGGALFNDVALLVLESPLELTEVVGTICLPEQGENMDGQNCVVSGWGKDVFGKEGKYQVILKRVDQPVVPSGPCQAALRKTRLGPRFRLHESFLCAGGVKGKDACKGDGGSPLVCPSKKNPTAYVQAGVVAWGIGCGTETPAVYANVAHFRTWIDEKLASLNLK